MFVSNLIFLTERIVLAFNYRNFGLLLILPIGALFLFNIFLSKKIVHKIFFVGSIFLVVSGFVSLFAFFYPEYGNSDIYLQVGIIIELVIFNIGLGLRSKVIQNEKDAELHQLILRLKESEENQKNLNIHLEEKVEERTQKINEINQELT